MFACITPSSGSIAFGFLNNCSESMSSCPNSSKIAGYCPFLGSMVGVNNIFCAIFGLRQNNIETVVALDPLQRAQLGVRGLVELFSVGIVWLPVDLLVTMVQGVVLFAQSKLGHES